MNGPRAWLRTATTIVGCLALPVLILIVIALAWAFVVIVVQGR